MGGPAAAAAEPAGPPAAPASTEGWIPLSYDALRDKNVNLFRRLNSVIFPIQYGVRARARARREQLTPC